MVGTQCWAQLSSEASNFQQIDSRQLEDLLDIIQLDDQGLSSGLTGLKLPEYSDELGLSVEEGFDDDWRITLERNPALLQSADQFIS